MSINHRQTTTDGKAFNSCGNMKKKKILIFHYNLQGGGAERVLVNLLKYLDLTKYDITLKTVFGSGPYVKDIPDGVKYSCVFKREFKGFNTIMKALPGGFWHRLFIRGQYDIEIAYLENSPTRIVAACPHKDTKKVGWVHTEVDNPMDVILGFRNRKEMITAHNHLDEVVFVSIRAMRRFKNMFPEVTVPAMRVIHNVNDYGKLYSLATEDILLDYKKSELNICSVGRLIHVKGFHRLIAPCAKLKNDGLLNDVRFYILGNGPERESIEQLIAEKGLTDHIKLLGFAPNPYKYVSKMDLFVCTSYREGYSTATTEAIALGVPVFTTDCSGMEEILDGGKFGMIVPNEDEAIYEGLKELLTHRERITQYADAIKAAPPMTTQSLVDKYEEFLDSL